MTKTEKYLENNLLLAKFMGAKQTEFAKFWIPIHGVVRDDTLETGRGRIMEYHWSWDWLMPVVRRCVEIACDESQEMFMSKQYTMLLDIVPMADIEETYKAVVEFVKKYNSK